MGGPSPASACLSFLEAAYAWELDENTWLRGLAEALVEVWGEPRWAVAWVYDASDSSGVRYGRPVLCGASKAVREIVEKGLPRHETRPEGVQIFRTVSVGFGRPIRAMDDIAEKGFSEEETADLFGINGLDASGLGCFIGVGAERTTITAQEMLMYDRLAAHVSSAYRCRRRLQASASPLDGSEAVLDVEGKVIDAKGPAETRTARESLREATRSIQALRRRATRDDPTSRWRPRVSGRWTLVDATDPHGDVLIAARENQSRPVGLDALTEREREVVASAIAGRSPKEIAYDLGISYATTRVLLARAYTRLGVRTRNQLFALPSIRALRGVPLGGSANEGS